MIPRLHESLAEQPEMALEHFQILSKLWKRQMRTIPIVVEGAGDVFWKKYWEDLSMMAARPGRAKLWVTDLHALDQPLMSKMKACNVAFVDKSQDNDLRLYERLTADVVFILTGDAVHLRTAGRWLGELEWGKRAAAIFMEKPYDRHVGEAEPFYEKLLRTRDESSTLFIPFDHYLGRVHEFVKNKHQLLPLVGRIQEIRFGMTEPNGVEESRKDSVKLGMIFDMFCHQLAILSELFDIGNIRFEKVLAAKHEGSPIGDADTFAYLDCFVPDSTGAPVPVRGCVGKGVGEKEHKYFFIRGEAADLDLDISQKKIVLVRDKTKVPLYEIHDGHRVILRQLFEENYLESPIGALSHRTSLKVLKKISEAKSLAGERSLLVYKVGEQKDDILKRLSVIE